MKKENFIGKAALETLRAGGTRTLVGLVGERRNIPRTHDKLVDSEGNEVGEVTSGTFSPSLNHPIALGYLPEALAKNGDTIYFASRGKQLPLTITGRNFMEKP